MRFTESLSCNTVISHEILPEIPSHYDVTAKVQRSLIGSHVYYVTSEIANLLSVKLDIGLAYAFNNQWFDLNI